MAEPCRIIGVLDNGTDGLTPAALAHLRRADLIIGAARTLALFADQFDPQAVTRDLAGRLSSVPDWIREGREQGLALVVLATGDPLCHGIAGFLGSHLSPEAIEVVPNVSTVQLACARLGLAWNDLRILSVHHEDCGEWRVGAGPEHRLYPVLRALERHDRLAILTSPENAPDRIARMLVAEGFGDELRVTVAEHLAWDDEQIIVDCGLAEAAGRRFADPNVLVLARKVPRRRQVLFGLPDDDYGQRRPERGLITKREVRAVSLARLQLRADSRVWDIGAGSGALGLEAAKLCGDGHVYAIEKNADDVAIAAENRVRLGVHNHTLVHGKAPAGLDCWPDPDAVFIGGSGGELAGLIVLCLRRLAPEGVLVMNLVTFENLGTAIEVLKTSGVAWDVTQLQSSRSRPVLDLHRLAAENPVWILCAQAKSEPSLGRRAVSASAARSPAHFPSADNEPD